MNYTILIIFVVAVFLTIFLFIGDRIMYKDALEQIRVGGKYTTYAKSDDPFAPYVTVTEIKYNKNNEPYVKFEYPDGTTHTTHLYHFFKNFNVFEEKGES